MREAIDGALSAGLTSIGLWREPVAEVGVDRAVAWMAEAGLRVSSLCRGGFFAAAAPEERAGAHESNLLAIEETARLRAATLVLVPGRPPPGGQGHRGGQGASDERHR